jgi:hypothetical protein
MGMDETFVIPLKRRGPNGMFTLREIFYNEKLRRRFEWGQFPGYGGGQKGRFPAPNPGRGAQE